MPVTFPVNPGGSCFRLKNTYIILKQAYDPKGVFIIVVLRMLKIDVLDGVDRSSDTSGNFVANTIVIKWSNRS